jgi:hypothetical protein
VFRQIDLAKTYTKIFFEIINREKYREKGESQKNYNLINFLIILLIFVDFKNFGIKMALLFQKLNINDFSDFYFFFKEGINEFSDEVLLLFISDYFKDIEGSLELKLICEKIIKKEIKDFKELKSEFLKNFDQIEKSNEYISLKIGYLEFKNMNDVIQCLFT